jgi:hypothetical protein
MYTLYTHHCIKAYKHLLAYISGNCARWIHHGTKDVVRVEQVSAYRDCCWYIGEKKKSACVYAESIFDFCTKHACSCMLMCATQRATRMPSQQRPVQSLLPCQGAGMDLSNTLLLMLLTSWSTPITTVDHFDSMIPATILPIPAIGNSYIRNNWVFEFLHTLG